MRYRAETSDWPDRLRRLRLPWRRYDRNGYAIVRGGLDRAAVQRLGALVRERLPTYGGEIARGVNGSPMNMHIAAPADLAEVRDALQAVIFSDAMFRTLRGLDGERHYTIHQTLIFLASPACDLHIDGWGVDTVPRGFAHTAWIPLEDLQPEAGLPACVPWRRGRVFSNGAARGGVLPGHGEDYVHFHDALIEQLGDRPTVTAPLRAGDVFAWASLTPHKSPPGNGGSRLALQVLIRPSRLPHGTYRMQPRRRPAYRVVEVDERFAYMADVAH